MGKLSMVVVEKGDFACVQTVIGADYPDLAFFCQLFEDRAPGFDIPDRVAYVLPDHRGNEHRVAVVVGSLSGMG